MFELLREKVAAGGPVTAAVVHAERREKAEEWGAKSREQYEVKELTITDVGPVIGTHTGPGTLGVILCPEYRLKGSRQYDRESAGRVTDEISFGV